MSTIGALMIDKPSSDPFRGFAHFIERLSFKLKLPLDDFPRSFYHELLDIPFSPDKELLFSIESVTSSFKSQISIDIQICW
jgi:hypothetical protein